MTASTRAARTRTRRGRQSRAELQAEAASLARELAEAREQQAATGDVLRVISRAGSDVRPVFETVVEHAIRLCGADAGQLYTAVPDETASESLYRLAVAFGGADAYREYLARHPIRPGRGTVVGKVALERRPVHIEDVLADAEYEWREAQQLGGFRTLAGVPLLRAGAPIGVIVLWRRAVRPFAGRQLELVSTFADQAAIAIENARVLAELRARTRDLTETVEQQAATREVLGVIADAPTDLRRVLDAVAASAARLCDSEDALIYRLGGERGGVLRPEAHHGPLPGGPDGLEVPASRGAVVGRAVVDRRTVHVHDLAAESEAEFPIGRAWHRRSGQRTTLATPLLREGAPIGGILIRRTEVRPFTGAQIALLETFADQAVIALENTRLFQELEERNRELTEALEQQTATGEVLRVIAGAPADLQRVLAAMAESAGRLCEATSTQIVRVDGDAFRLMVRVGPGQGVPVGTVGSLAAERGNITVEAILQRRTIHVPDFEASAGDEFPATKASAARNGYRTIACVPLLRRGEPIGAITVRRSEARQFRPQQIALLETFADQAVIAIENTRLFTELQDRTRDLARSVDELTALAAVTQVVSSTLDLEEVLARILAQARRLSGSDGGEIFEYDAPSDTFHLRSAEQLDAPLATIVRAAPFRRGEGAVGQAATTRAPVQIPDIQVEGAYQSRLRDALLAAGYRALLAVPLLREDQVLGGLVLNRRQPGDFPAEVVALMQTFASQSALAIQNARLFRELEGKGRELEEASRHKSEFLAAMSHELRTPLNAVIGFSEVLLERMVGDLNGRQEAYLEDILASGRHLLSLINDILDLSKVEAGRMELELEPFSLAGALEEGLTMVREAAGRRGVALGLAVDPGLGPVEADARKVKQVVFNLLANAVKFTPAGGRVEVAAGPAGGEVRVAVRDTGIGIAPADRERIFEAFHQAGRAGAAGGAGGAAAPPAREGTGLGLALAKRFVELHGGRLWVESAPGAGSTFTFTLPRRRGPPAPEAPAPAASVAGVGAAQAGTGPTVLLVDDDPRTVELLTLYLGGAGFEVVVARDGEAALALARRVRPAVITLDVLLPRLDGWGFLARAKADPALAGVPVVVVSMLDERGKGFALGAAEYLVKPVGREALLGALRRLLPPADAAAGRTPAGAVGAAPTVLAIDDDPLAVELLRATLGAEGYRVLTAAGGEEGVALARRESPALVVLDLLLPGLDGFAVVERLRADPGTAAVPIVILTAKTMTAADKARLNGRISVLAEKSAFSRAGFVALVRRLCPGPDATAPTARVH